MDILYFKNIIESQYDIALVISKKGYLMYNNQKLVHQKTYINKSSLANSNRYFSSTIEQMIIKLAENYSWTKSNSK